MARRRKTTAPLTAHADPAAALDEAAFLAAARARLGDLTEDLLRRLDESPGIVGLEAHHAEEVEKQRTADPFPVWRRAWVVQVAVAWLLSCVFVRTLEDRDLLARKRLAGPGARDSERLFGQLAPFLNPRDYLLTVFRELSRLPAAAPLFDVRHNPVWRLAPSAEGARALLELLRAPDPEAPAFRFGQESTRFLGDLYQELSDEVKARYALLQTPEFVEEFILDRTLEPALAEFGLEHTRLIDPTCGSGHFLLGAFARLLDRHEAHAPNLPRVELARRALAAVHGVDLNPYAVAIARFRLWLAFHEAIGTKRLTKETPAPPLHVEVGDSLLFSTGQRDFYDQEGVDIEPWTPASFSFEDPVRLRAVLGQTYEAVVGNPPYITVKDKALRERYRAMYPHSAAGKYALSAPFMERFFLLARRGGFTGQITANSFMKREFGKKLIEHTLAKLDVQLIVNTAGAYIPGHGTPTVLVFGQHRAPEATTVRAVLAKRGEPSTPDDPAKGKVWTSLLAGWNTPGYESEYLSVEDVARESLVQHPWSLEGGGAGQLKELIESRAGGTLGSVADSIGITSFTLEDEVFLRPEDAWRRGSFPREYLRPMVIGEAIRDWGVGSTPVAFFPYDSSLEPVESQDDWVRRALWLHKVNLSNNILFGGKTKVEGGLRWYEYGRLTTSKLKTPLSIAYAEVATHNHFVLDRGGKVFKQTAPIIKLKPEASEDDHLALLAYLNSSTACFWMKQIAYPKGTTTGDISTEKGIPENNRYAFSGTGLQCLPVPDDLPSKAMIGLIPFSRRLEALQIRRDAVSPETTVRAGSDEALTAALARAERTDVELRAEMIAVQEDLDWAVYRRLGLVDDETAVRPCPEGTRLGDDERPFQRAQPPAHLKGEARTIWARRRACVEKSKELRLIENAVCKRRWWGARGVFASKVATFAEQGVSAGKEVLGERLEALLGGDSSPVTRMTLREGLTKPVDARLLEFLQESGEERPLVAVLARECVPFLAALRYSEAGLEKRAAWEETWALQRREDAGEEVDEIPVPPKYGTTDFRDANFYRLRGKLDVPKERFISYPGLESDSDGEPVYGWAGWDPLQRAAALADLYDRRTREGWGSERVTPILAGLLELLPWLKQWHNESDAEGARMGDAYELMLDDECHRHGLTREDLLVWRPPGGKGRGRKKKAAKAKTTKQSVAEKAQAEQPAAASRPKKKRKTRKKQAAKDHTAAAQLGLGVPEAGAEEGR